MSNRAPKVDPGSWLLFLASAVAILLAVFVLVSSLINTVKRNSTKGEVDGSQLVMSATDNLKPIGVSVTSDAKPAAPAAARSGKEVFGAVCTVCHTTGVAGAPKISDKAAWEPRVATGLDALMNTAINGKGAMPARGGNPSVTDAELKATILYMTKEAGFDLGGDAAPAKAEEKPAAAEPEKKQEVAEEPAKEEPKAEMATKEEPKAPAEKPAPVQPATPAEPSTPEVAAAPATPAMAEASAPAPSEDGKKIYSTTCFACHATGVAGSPKFGDKAAWEPRIATGMDALYATALNGKGAMPPKGGNVSLSDEKVKAAVDYMVSQAK